jgi:exodeoxyribonuclease VII large subunit
VRRYATTAQARLERVAAARPFRRPHDLVLDLSRRLDELATRSGRAMRASASEHRGRLAMLAGKLESLSPLAVLERGYSITLDAKSGRVVRDASKLKVGQSITTRLARGAATSTVEELDTEAR